MRKIIITGICYLMTGILCAQAPVFQWAKGIGGTSGEQGYSIATDTSGNVFSTGVFQGTADFDPGAGILNLTAIGSLDIFIVKLNSSGNLLWAKTMGGTNDELAHSIALDPLGNVYTTGGFSATTDFDPGAGTFNLTATANSDIFISKLDASGNFLWAKKMGATSWNYGYSLTVDVSGNVYTTGSFAGTVDFDPGAGIFNLTTAGQSDIFISKLDASGNFLWAKNMGGSSGDVAYSIATDASGNIFTTGVFQGTADFDPSAVVYNLSSAGQSDIFISKLDASGNFLWAKTIGGTDTEQSKSIATDASGNVFTTGDFRGTCDFDPSAGVVNLTSISGASIFIAKLDASGNFIWAKAMGGLLGGNIGNSIATDTSGNVLTTGNFSDTVDFDPGAGVFNIASKGGEDIFIAKLDASGNFIWAKAMGGANTDWGKSITIDTLGNIFTTGSFQGTVDFDPSAGIVNLIGNPSADVFIHKMSPCASFTPAISGNTTICTGNSTSLTGSGGTSYNWTCTGGIPSVSTVQNPSILYNSPGTYSVMLIVSNAGGCSDTATTTVNVNPTPTVSISGSSATVCVGNSATLTATGGATYSWNTGEVTAIISVSPTVATTYTVSGTNALGCSATATISVTNLLPIPITTTTTPTSCGLYSGTVAASVSGAGAVPPFSFLWNCGDTSSALSGLEAGIYRVNVTDGNGCFSFADALVTSSNGPALTTGSVTDVTCFGLSTGAIDMNVIGGSTPYTFFWSNGTTTEDISNVSYGPYEIVVTDAGGCSVTKSIFVNQPDPLSISSTAATASCSVSNGSASAVVAGGNSPYNYLWSSGGTTSVSTGLAAGVYTVFITDSKGCFDSLLVGIHNSGGPIVAVDTISAANCGTNGFVLILPQDSGLIASYSWTTGSTTQNLNNAVAGNYGLVVTDTNGCKSTLVVPVMPVLPPIKPICLVTVDTLSNMNIVVWEKPISTFIAGFNIYRESSQNGIYQLIATQTYSMLTTYYDSIVNTADRWAKYRISMKDICGREGPLSPEHKTIHLSVQSASYDSTFLIWDAYVGYTFSYYHIFRKDSAAGFWDLIDSVPANQTTYLDDTIPHTGDTIFYHVDVDHGGGDCIATIKNPEPMAKTVKSSKSNSSDRVTNPASSVAEISENLWLSIYPNPSSGAFTIQMDNGQWIIDNGNTSTIKIYNVLGELQHQTNVRGAKTEITIPDITKGIYQLQITSRSGIVNRKIVISR